MSTFPLHVGLPVEAIRDRGALAACLDAIERHGGAGVTVRSDAVRNPACTEWLDGELKLRRLRLLGLHVTLDLAQRPGVERPKDGASLMMASLASADPHDKPSAPRAGPRAAALVSEVARHLAPGARLALLPRIDHWMAMIADACRLAMRVNRPNVGVAISIDDWLATDGEATRLRDRLRLAGPKLWCVSVTSARAADDAARQFLQQLRAAGYRGPLELAIDDRDASPEDIGEQLRRAIAALQ